jgi:DNA-binding ferritin-like protein
MTDNRQRNSTLLSLGAGVEARVAKLLSGLLADAVFMYSLYKKYQWHVEGDDYLQYSQLFAMHAQEQLNVIEALGTRIRMLGEQAPVLPAEVTAAMTLKEPSDPKGEDEDMIENLCTVHEKYVMNLRQVIDKTVTAKDFGTYDLLVSRVLRVNENQLLIVRSSLD